MGTGGRKAGGDGWSEGVKCAGRGWWSVGLWEEACMLAEKVGGLAEVQGVLVGYEMAVGVSLYLVKVWEVDGMGGKEYVGHTGQRHRCAATPYLQ